MKKPSVFAQQQLPHNVYESDKHFKYRINERYYFTQVILCQQKINFHLGFDLIEQKQVLVVSFIDKQELKQQIQNFNEIPLKILWKGITLIKRVRYFFIVMKKNGCFIYESLHNQEQKKLSWFLLICKLYIEFLFRNTQTKTVSNQINIKTLLFICNAKRKKLQLKYWNKSLILYQSNQNFLRIQAQKYTQKNQQKNQTSRVSISNKKSYVKRDLRYGLIEIKKYFQEIPNQGKLKNINFEEQIKNIVFNLKQTGKVKTLQDWITAIEKTANNKNIKLKQFQEEARLRVSQIIVQNQVNIHKLCAQLNINKNQTKDCQSQNLENLESDLEENDVEEGIQQIMVNHTLTPKFMNFSGQDL